MIAYPAYWEEVAKQMYADGEDRALKLAVQFAEEPGERTINSMMVFGNWPWFYEQWEQRYWFAKDDDGHALIPEDLR